MSDSDRDDPPPPQSDSESEEGAPPPPQDDDEEPPQDEEDDPKSKSTSGYEVSHSPLRVSDARKKFQSGGEEEESKPKPGGPAKPAGAPKPQNGKYKYADLKQPGSKLTKDQIDVTCREDYLSKDEFSEVFECTVDEFKKMPQWKRDQKKKAVGLF
eukprot:TRINITY_DN238_c2_g3_i1.p1 TRINITY_DN238_c2_g3~~TRINITY_DN238_c2_g3_i1.p1  ORF type:complete len:156 (+),score=45.14 TRINITY_DN238_c2_g3_i1:52-519(+)